MGEGIGVAEVLVVDELRTTVALGRAVGVSVGAGAVVGVAICDVVAVAGTDAVGTDRVAVAAAG